MASAPPTKPAYFSRASGGRRPAARPLDTISEASPPPLRTRQASCFIVIIWSTKESLPLTDSKMRADTLSSVSSSLAVSSMYSLANPSRRAAFGLVKACQVSACSAVIDLCSRCNSGSSVARSAKSIDSKIPSADCKAGISESRMPRTYFSIVGSMVWSLLSSRNVVARSVRRLCKTLNANPEASATTAIRLASERRRQQSQAFNVSMTTTATAIVAMVDLSSTLADSRLSMEPSRAQFHGSVI